VEDEVKTPDANDEDEVKTPDANEEENSEDSSEGIKFRGRKLGERG